MKVKFIKSKWPNDPTFTPGNIYEATDKPDVNGVIGVLDDQGKESALWPDEFEVVGADS